MAAISQPASVVVVGAGVAGLAAADDLARHGLTVQVIEKSDRIGGHAAQFGCKATTACVQCGACRVHDYMRRTTAAPQIRFHLNRTIEAVQDKRPFHLRLAAAGDPGEIDADAILFAIGFQVFDARTKPYGYGVLKNVLTNLDVERRMRHDGTLTRPSDARVPKKVAFIQCVGSRDRQSRHLWCSHYCCGSSLRMADRLRYLHPATEVTVFYIDIQSFGKTFQTSYERMRQEMRFIRALPGDIVACDDDDCKISYFDPGSGRSQEAVFDLVIMAVGMAPSGDHLQTAQLVTSPLSADGFFQPEGLPAGIFCAGAAKGPMTIAESIASGSRAAWQIIAYLRERGQDV